MEGAREPLWKENAMNGGIIQKGMLPVAADATGNEEEEHVRGYVKYLHPTGTSVQCRSSGAIRSIATW